MSVFADYIRAEFAFIPPVLVFIGQKIKKRFPNRKENIPFYLMAVSILITSLYIVFMSDVNYDNWHTVLFPAVVQGILAAMAADWGYNVCYKQCYKRYYKRYYE